MWIIATLFAAACQSMRTAFQKNLSKEMGFLHATMARSLYGLPLVLLYLGACLGLAGPVQVSESGVFYGYVLVCAIAQILATWLMLRVFQSGSYALGTLLAKTEAVLVALIGIPLLHHTLSISAWIGIVLGGIGALVMSANGANIRRLHRDPSLWAGLGSGLLFAITSVAAALASQHLQGPVLSRSALTLTLVLAIQALLLGGLQIWQQRDPLAPLRGNWRLSSKVGILSSLGSIGWFTGFALVNPALVKTLGQVEILGTLYFSRVKFGEQIQPWQWLGGALIVTSVVLVTAGHL